MTSFATVEGRKLRRKVRAVVTDQTGRVLLIRPHGYAEDCWTLPGGGVEAGETAVEAVSRELQEELGLSVEQADQAVPLNIRSEFVYRPDHKEKRGLDHDGQLAEIFHCLLPAGIRICRQVEEIEAVGWFTQGEALEAFKVPAQRSLFARCLDALLASQAGRNAA
jgi:8-oxo-dGTP pyrophosphatase MutT (NUDIX family)